MNSGRDFGFAYVGRPFDPNAFLRPSLKYFFKLFNVTVFIIRRLKERRFSRRQKDIRVVS